MFAKSIVIEILLYIIYIICSVYCVHHNSITELNEQFIRKYCCFDNVDKNNENSCNLKNFNCTLMITSQNIFGNISDVPCCSSYAESEYTVNNTYISINIFYILHIKYIYDDF